MYKNMVIYVVAFIAVITVIPVIAQEVVFDGVPGAENLPEIVAVFLGLLSTVIAEFVQKQKNPLISLAIALGVSTLVGLVSALVTGVPFTDLPVLIGKIWAYGTTAWATVFKGMGLSKKLGTSS